jgi:hypothetical protein
MKLAKILFTLTVIAFYGAWVWGARSAWQALTLPQFAIALGLYLPASTLVLFWAGMAIERGKKTGVMPELSAYLVKLLWPFAALHNAGNNVLTMTVVCLDPPRWFELATTKRVNRYADEEPDWWVRLTGASWRRSVAQFLRTQLLDWADPDGVHR